MSASVSNEQATAVPYTKLAEDDLNATKITATYGTPPATPNGMNASITKMTVANEMTAATVDRSLRSFVPTVEKDLGVLVMCGFATAITAVASPNLELRLGS